jgi:hypothetical protein
MTTHFSGSCLVQQATQWQARPGFEFGAADGAIVIGLAGPELPLDKRQVLIFIQRAVVIAIRPAKLGGGYSPAAKFRTAEPSGTIAIQVREHERGCALGLVEVDRAVAIAIDARE